MGTPRDPPGSTEVPARSRRARWPGNAPSPGCEIEEILDAAHLAKRAPGGSDDPSNGIDPAGRHPPSVSTRASSGSTRRHGRSWLRIGSPDTDYRNISGQAVQSAADLRQTAAGICERGHRNIVPPEGRPFVWDANL